jgi:hypothetical protein
MAKVEHYRGLDTDLEKLWTAEDNTPIKVVISVVKKKYESVCPELKDLLDNLWQILGYFKS